MKIIIVGAVAGGATVASQIRRTVPNAEITLIGMEEKIGYGTCGLPFVIGGMIDEPRKVAGPNPERFSDGKGIDVLTSHEVLSIDRTNQTIQVRNLKTGLEFTEQYDKLILSTGETSRLPNYEGIDTIPFFTLKNYNDMKKIMAHLDAKQPKSVTIIGSGFIGIELAENFIFRGLKTSVLIRGDYVMSAMDPEISTVLYDEMEMNGVQLYTQTEIQQIDGNKLILNNGQTLETDLLIASIGTIPNTSLASEAGLSIGETKGVAVNDYLQTDDPNIYAIGDIAECKDWVTGKPKRVQLAWHAHRQAFIVASHLANHPVKLNPFLGTTITKLFSLSAGMTGLSEKELQAEKLDYETAIYEGRTNAGYYPDSGKILLRVHYDRKTRQILGAQAVGNKGVDKRMDVIVTAIMGNLSIDDLAALELSYSPPYSSPKDPVNMIGYKAASSKN